MITGSRSSPGPQMALRSTYCISSPSWTQRVKRKLVSGERAREVEQERKPAGVAPEPEPVWGD